MADTIPTTIKFKVIQFHKVKFFFLHYNYLPFGEAEPILDPDFLGFLTMKE